MPLPTNIFDVTQPPDSQAANLIGQDLRSLALNIQQRMALISGPIASIWNPNADAQPFNWAGLLYYATDTQQFFQWSGSAWVGLKNPGGYASFFNLGVGTIAIPGNTLIVGSSIDCWVVGTTNGGSSGTAQMGLSVGASVLVSTAVNSTNTPNFTALYTKLFCISIGIAPNLLYVPTYGTNGQTLTDNLSSPLSIGSNTTVTGTGTVVINFTKVVIST